MYWRKHCTYYVSTYTYTYRSTIYVVTLNFTACPSSCPLVEVGGGEIYTREHTHSFVPVPVSATGTVPMCMHVCAHIYKHVQQAQNSPSRSGQRPHRQSTDCLELLSRAQAHTKPNRMKHDYLRCPALPFRFDFASCWQEATDWPRVCSILPSDTTWRSEAHCRTCLMSFKLQCRHSGFTPQSFTIRSSAGLFQICIMVQLHS